MMTTQCLAFVLRMPRKKLVQICGTSVRHRQRVTRVYQKALKRAEVRSRLSPLCSQHVRIYTFYLLSNILLFVVLLSLLLEHVAAQARQVC
jgi:hypothetical protein